MRTLKMSLITGATVLALAACAGMDTSTGPGPGDHPPTKAEIDGADWASRTKILADDAFEGRGPGTPKGEAAADWIADEMKRLGLKPGVNGGYFQDVPAASITLDPAKSTFEITGPDGTKQLKFAEEVAFWSPRFDKTDQKVENSDLVFVGYGVTAPSEKWDDFKGIDVKARRSSCSSTIRLHTRDKKMFKGGDDLLRPLDLQSSKRPRAEPPPSSSSTNRTRRLRLASRAQLEPRREILPRQTERQRRPRRRPLLDHGRRRERPLCTRGPRLREVTHRGQQARV
jgi:hypothetical protein